MELKVFISWSGERGKDMAEALREWLPKVIHRLRPWLSTTDIRKGAIWQMEVRRHLEDAGAGIICLTSESLGEPWILFEAGALSRNFPDPKLVCPLLLDLERHQVEDPLAQFQLSQFNKSDMFMLVQTFYRLVGAGDLTDDQFRETFEVWWPSLEKKVGEIRGRKIAPDAASFTANSARDAISRIGKLEELLRNLVEDHNPGFSLAMSTSSNAGGFLGKESLEQNELAREKFIALGEKLMAEDQPDSGRTGHLAELLLLMQVELGDIRTKIDELAGEVDS
jgi:TIR domain